MVKKFSFFSSAFLTFILLLPCTARSQQPQRIFIDLDQAISMSLTKNHLLKASDFAFKKARWEHLHSWTQLLPAIHFNTRYTWIDDSTFALRDFSRYFRDMPSGLGFKIPQTVFQKSFYTSVDLDLQLVNAAIWNGISLSSASSDLAFHQREASKDNTVFQVISAYLDALFARKALDLQKEYLSLSQLNYDKALRLQKAGRYSKNEALRWKVDYQQQKSMVAGSQSNLRAAMVTLARVVNISMDAQIILDQEIPQKLQEESRRLQHLSDREIVAMVRLNDEQLAEVNQNLAASRTVQEVNRLNYRGSYASYLPSLSLHYSYAWRENDTPALDDYSPQILMVNLSIPLFNGFQNVTKTKAAYYAYQQSKEQFADRLQYTRFTLTQMANALNNLKAQLQLSAINIEYSKNNYRVVAKQKEQGLISNIAFIDAKLALQNARLTHLKNEFSFISTMVQLYYMIGKLPQLI